MLTCFYCGKEAADLEQHAEENVPCARKALAFIGPLPVALFGDRQEKAGAIRRARARIALAKSKPKSDFLTHFRLRFTTTPAHSLRQ